MSNNAEDIKEKKIKVTSSSYVTIGSLFAILLWAITSTALLVQKISVDPKKERIGELTESLQEEQQKYKQVEKLSEDNASRLKETIDKVSEKYRYLLSKENAPVPLFPRDGETLIGDQVTLKLANKDSNQYQSYLFELVPVIDGQTNGRIIRNSLSPGETEINFPLSSFYSQQDLMPGHSHGGVFFWRVRIGYTDNNGEHVQGPASSWSMFSAYRTVLDKIKSTKILRIGISPTPYGMFDTYDNSGNIVGYDVKLGNEIANELGTSEFIGKKVKAVFVPISFPLLLPKLRDREIDMVISSMTRTGPRETGYGVKFSHGYCESHQTLYGKDGNQINARDLKGAIVGATAGTTNAEAAKFLAKKYGFRVKPAYRSYADLVDALDSGAVKYVLVDDILFDRYARRTGSFKKINIDFSETLRPYYRSKLQIDKEEYAIAVANPIRPRGDNLHKFTNDILEMLKKNGFLRQLSKKYTHNLCRAS